MPKKKKNNEAELEKEQPKHDLSPYFKDFDYTFGFDYMETVQIENGRYRINFKRYWKGNNSGAEKETQKNQLPTEKYYF